MIWILKKLDFAISEKNERLMAKLHLLIILINIYFAFSYIKTFVKSVTDSSRKLRLNDLERIQEAMAQLKQSSDF